MYRVKKAVWELYYPTSGKKGLFSQWVPEPHHGGPHAVVPAQHFESAGVVPLQVPPESLHEPMNQKIPGTTHMDWPAGS